MKPWTWDQTIEGRVYGVQITAHARARLRERFDKCWRKDVWRRRISQAFPDWMRPWHPAEVRDGRAIDFGDGVWAVCKPEGHALIVVTVLTKRMTEIRSVDLTG